MLNYQLQYSSCLPLLFISQRILSSKNEVQESYDPRITRSLHDMLIGTFTNLGSLDKSILLILGT